MGKAIIFPSESWLVGVDRACEARSNDATVIRFKLLIECVEGVCSRLDLECWANIHDEINLDQTDGVTSIKKPGGFLMNSLSRRVCLLFIDFELFA